VRYLKKIKDNRGRKPIMIVCPFCEGGTISKAKITKLEIQVYICEECDSMWETLDISKDNCYDFSDYMEQNGLKGLWSELNDIERL
jgi:transcription elongation factor Elf1